VTWPESEELLEGLAAVAAGATTPRPALDDAALSALARRFMDGEAIDLEAAFAGRAVRVALPTYAFQVRYIACDERVAIA
jgi:hypothetical protein